MSHAGAAPLLTVSSPGTNAQTDGSRNVVICCDGTNNEFGSHNTNVVRLVQVLSGPAGAQIVYYDPGIGTLPEPWFITRAARAVSEKIDLAFATGLHAKIERAYGFLMDVWQPGDRVYLFGFSRGAYTVRVLAALLHAVGLLPQRTQNLVPYALRLFASLRGAAKADDRASYWPLCAAFRDTFARPVDDSGTRSFPVTFMGVWDTVSSVGWAWDPPTYPFTARNPSVQVARHAISLDERRAFFRQNRMLPAAGQDLHEVWFPGVHSDVGGGYAGGGLWRAPFEWITTEAQRCGLLVDQVRCTAMLRADGVPQDYWMGPIHNSLTGGWWLAELFPKLPHNLAGFRLPHLGLGKRRQVTEGSELHATLLQRVCGDPKYSPRNLDVSFLEQFKRSGPPAKNVVYPGCGDPGQ